MEARIARVAVLAAVFVSTAGVSFGATRRTPNFNVEAATQELADKIGYQAEVYRRDLAIEWLGRTLPNWRQPCPIKAHVAPNLGAGGATSFQFDQGQVFGWQMNIQGTEQRLLDSVLPHEITHTIFATYFRRPLPRWADEGACTTVEHVSEKDKQQHMLIQFLRTNRGIPFSQMFAMRDYPPDVLPLYAQGYSLARYLIDRGGKQRFLQFVGQGMDTGSWAGALQKNYGVSNLSELQNTWLAWVKEGSPQANSNTEIAAAPRRERPEPNLIFRGQSEDPPTAAATNGSVYSSIHPASYSKPANSGSQVATVFAKPKRADFDGDAAASGSSAQQSASSDGWNPVSTQGAQASSAPAASQPVGSDGAAQASGDSSRRVVLEWSRDTTVLR